MSAKPVVVTGDDSEQRFVAWVEKLELSFQNYLSLPNEDGSDKETMLNSIRDTLQSDTVNYPKWISLQKTVKLGKFASSSTDLKVFLRHVTFPGVLQSYHDLHNEILESSIDGKNDSNNHQTFPMDIIPVSSKDGSNSQTVRDFFQSISKANPDGLMGLCKLADIHHRINRAAEHDCHQVSTWLENERSRGINSEHSLTEREMKLKQLTGQDQQAVLETSFGGLKSELSVLNDALVRAEEEEELARKAYEAAVQRKKISLDKLSNMETFIESATSQREVLKKIHAIRLDMDQFNRDSAKQRVGLFQGVLSYLTRVRNDVLDDRLVKEIPALFSHLVTLFAAGSDSPSTEMQKKNGNGNGQTQSNASLYCAARVGKETIRLWKQLNADHLYPALSRQIEEFTDELSKLQSTLVIPSSSDEESGTVFRADNSTVVLYFDHLYHDTPEAHVEAQSRVSTCMKMLSTRLSRSSGYGSLNSTDETYRCRKMHILNCNDVLAPPTWCLPLTHSPQYLAHLWRLAEEASEGDLYVPLEFDTEWESEDPYRSGSDDEEAPGSRRHAGHLHKTMALPKRVSSTVGEAFSQSFSTLLTPDDGDAVIAKVIRKLEQREAAKMSARRRRDVDYMAAGKARNRRKRVSSDSAGEISGRVKTPYGNGMLLPVSGVPRTDGIQEVRMDYGAIGYFHSSCIQMVVEADNDDMDAVGAVSSGRARGRQSGGEGRSDDSRFVHTDLRLHRVLQRMVARVKVQRILGDLIGLNHANLSLWMHGRTSAGLNKTVERAIFKFLTSYDRKQLNRLLLDTDNDEYSPENAAIFLARLESTKIKKSGEQDAESSGGESGSEDGDDVSKKGFMLNSDSEFDSDVERVNAIKYSEDKVQRKFASSGSRDDLSGQSARSSAAAARQQRQSSDGVRSRQPSIEARMAAKMSPDGEALRGLMTSIMRALRISQGAIASEYCKSFRYETSQGGVSAWFHYRGVNSTFNRMNRCALMWVEKYREQLSSAERAQFDGLSARMSASEEQPDEEDDDVENKSPVRVGSGNNRRPVDEEGDEDQEEGRGLDIDEEEEEAVEIDAVQKVEEAVATTTIVEEEEEDLLPIVEVEDDESIAFDVDAAAPSIEENAPSTPSEMEEKLVEEMADEMQMESDTDEAVIKEEKMVEEVEETNVAVESEPAAPSVSTEVVMSDEVVVEVVEEEKDDNLRYCNTAPTVPYVELVRTIADLHTAVLHEMFRRRMSLQDTVDDAGLGMVGVGKIALSKFMNIATVTNNQRGSKFCQLMLKWLEASRGEAEFDRNPAVKQEEKKKEVEGGRSKPSRTKTDQPFDQHTCGICNKHVSEFSNHKSFHMHIAWCYRRKAGVEPPPEYKMKNLGGDEGEGRGGRGGKRKASESTEKEEEDEDEVETKRSRGSGGRRQDQDGRKSVTSSGRGKASSLLPEDLASDGAMLVADHFALGSHYDTCDMCRERDVDQPQVLKCVSCPCVYHWKCCAESRKGAVFPTGKWYCAKCLESGAHQAELMPLEIKNSTAVENKWILVYSSALRRWRKAIVIAKHPTKYCCILAKWWRSDNRGGKTIWMDIAKATILVAAGEVPASNYSRNKLQQLSHSSHKQLGVKFEDQGRALNAQFKSQRSVMMHMDGLSNGSVPPGSQAASAGVGGAGALEGDEKGQATMSGNGMSDTYISSNSLKAALCAAGTACRAVDIAMCSENTNVFACIRPPGHHAGRYGCTGGCLSTGFCLLNNAALAAYYSRVRWGIERVAVIDIDVHFGNGTAELLRNDPNAFFASVHMIYGLENDGGPEVEAAHKKINAGFYPSLMGLTEVTDNYVSVGVYPSDESPLSTRANKTVSRKKVVDPASDSSSSDEEEGEEDIASLDESAMVLSEEALSTADSSSAAPTTGNSGSSSSSVDTSDKKDKKGEEPPVAPCAHAAGRKTYKGSEGFIRALGDVIIPQMVKFNPQLLIISAGFDGYVSDPIGGQLCLSLDDYTTATKMLTSAMDLINTTNGTTSGPKRGRVISLLEGGYDTSPFTLGLAKCVDAHVLALQES